MLEDKELRVTVEDSNGTLYTGVLIRQAGRKPRSSSVGRQKKSSGISGRKAAPKGSVREAILKLIDAGFLNEWRTDEEVHRHLRVKAFSFKLKAVSMCLFRMARNRELDREAFKEGGKDVYKYKTP